MNNITDQYIIDLFFTNGHINSNYNRDSWLNKHPEIKEYLDNRFKDSQSTKETLARILCNIENRPVCPVCGKLVRFEYNHRWCRNRNGWPFMKYCSSECQGKDNDVIIKRKNTCIKKYGVDNPFKADMIKDKIKKTNTKLYGVENVFASQKIKDKIKSTNLNRYGVECILSSNVNNNKKLQQIKDKSIATNIEKYGAERYSKSESFKELMASNKDEYMKKQYETKKKNHSFKVSYKENELYNIIKTYYPTVLRQYKSDKYPFMCDFYIPEYDMYIEYNGSWTHGNHPFDETNKDDVEKFKCYKAKINESLYYRNALETWTKRDVNKLNVAKTNNIKYLCLYNKINFNDVISKIENFNKSNDKILIVGI